MKNQSCHQYVKENYDFDSKSKVQSIMKIVVNSKGIENCVNAGLQPTRKNYFFNLFSVGCVTIKTNLVLLFTLFLFTLNINGASYYVTTKGSSAGNGTTSKPWDLQTALNHPIRVFGGDTIWIDEGTYTGVFTSKLKGRSTAPIVVRAMPGAKVVIDGNKPGASGNAALVIEGQYTYYWGLIITNTNGKRGTNASDFKDGVYFGGPYNKLINCIIHNNGGNGVGFWSTALNSEIYGCIIYNNGYRDTDRGHGHGIYGQNDTGTKVIKGNIMFNSFGIGIQIYTEGGSIKGFTIEDNIMFNSGLPGNDFLERHIIVGGKQPADRISIKNNYLYNRPDYPSKAAIQLGYGTANNVSAEVANNYMVDGTFYVIKSWNTVKFTENSVIAKKASNQLISFDDFGNIQSPTFNSNKYYLGKLATSSSFDAWKTFSGQDKNSSFTATLPTSTYHVLQKNQFEPGRGHLVIYNWGKLDTVKVELSSILAKGAEYKIYDVSNLSAGPISSGKYNGGDVNIPMKLTKVELPFGDLSDKGQFKHTAPDFGAFLIVGVNPVPKPGSTTPGTTPGTSTGSNPGTNPVDQTSSENPLRILNYYPNPTLDKVSVDFYSPEDYTITVDVFNSSGQFILSKSFNSKEGKNTHEIDLTFFPVGMYFISLSSELDRVTCKVLKKA